MEKRYQIFVSSTYEDLRGERQEVIQALLELDCIPSGMELFPAADEDQWTLIKRVIDDCDYYIAIIAGRYGSIGSEGTSYTQMEYEYAISAKKPVIAFLHAEPGKIAAEKTDPEHRDKLRSFRELVQKKICKSWTTPQELGSVVSRSIVKLMKEKPGVGWVRADLIPDENAALEILRLRTENDGLKRDLELTKSEPPKESKSLASGDEEIQLHFSFSSGGSGHVEESINVSWNKLFATLAPVMIDGASEIALKSKLGEFFRNRKFDNSRITIYNEYLRDEDFQRIKVQFRALGLIAKDDRQLGGAKTQWILTPYGDTVLTQVAAIPSSKGHKIELPADS